MLLRSLWVAYICVQGVGTDEECLFEILCSRTNEELDAIKKAYTQSKFYTNTCFLLSY